MNKKFSTILTMVLLLVGLSFSNNAYAALSGTKTLNAISGDAKLKNGVKFYLSDGANGCLTVSDVKFTKGDLKDVEGVTFGTPDASKDNAALFEVCDYELIAGNSIFSLKVGGKYVYTQKAAVATADDENKGTTIVATNKFMVVGDKLAFTSISAFLEGAKGIGVASTPAISFAGTDLVKPYNESAVVTAADLNGLAGSFSLNFAIPEGTTLFEDNIFAQEMLAVTTPGTKTNLGDLETNTTYFLVGPAAKLNAVKAKMTDGVLADEAAALTAIKADGIKVVTLKKDTKYEIANVPEGEGMKFVMEKAVDVFAADVVKNAGFAITELDKTNNPGAYELKLTPHTDIVSGSASLYAGAMRFTATDAKSYITTVTEANKGKLSLATNGISADLDASILLKNTMNVVNIYFTSGVPSTSEEADDNNTEYHKYLVAAAGASAFELQALPLDKLGGFASPLSQWVVTGFDGQNTFTFTNREASAAVNTLELTLLPTKVANEYKIVSAGTANSVANIYASGSTAKKALVNKTVKFNSIAATNSYLNLSKDEMKVAVSLSFSGKDANFGAKTFYGKFDAATPTTYKPSAKEATANFIFAKAANAKGETDYIQNELTYAYLDGEVVKTAKDTLFVPSYTLKAAGTEKDKCYLKHSFVELGDYKATADAAGTGEFVFRKNLDGTYAMTVVNSSSAAIGAVANYTAFATYNAKAIAPKADKTAFDNQTALFFAPKDADFAAITLTSANADRVSLPAVGRHATFDNVLGSVAMQSVDGITEGILKAEGLTFWLDTADSKATIPSFYISMAMPATTKADAEAPAERLFMYNSTDSLSLFNEGGAIAKVDKRYMLEETAADAYNAKAIFRAATIAAIDTLTTTIDGEAAVVTKEANDAKTVLGGLDNFKYNIFLADKDVEGEYLIASKEDGRYLYSLNGKLGFTADAAKALVVTLGEGDSPVSNEAVTTSSVKVIAAEGAVQIVGAQGKKVVVSNVLGQSIANTVISSDNETISAPAGVVIVAVEGEAAVKAIVK
ncbi:DUF6383 domain-containing protein [uncultured Parabacteroides sp.]|uniref:DUF6383 domain-containing protein n=1 Tax=uncultured Parabacteroides sp. TaxID=512312 RepID=UPI0025F2E368|nr:DUF6383 domain-containing protein [uncultured Parabacteroides sp.]